MEVLFTGGAGYVYVHVADLADAHIAALEQLPQVQGAFNLGTGSGDSVRRVLDVAEEVTGLTLRREIIGRRDGDPPTLEEAVRDAWLWMQAHPEGYAG